MFHFSHPICISYFFFRSLRTQQGMHFFPRIFFLLFALFHFYHFSFPYGFTYSTFITMMLFMIHSMMFFWHRYEILSIVRVGIRNQSEYNNNNMNHNGYDNDNNSPDGVTTNVGMDPYMNEQRNDILYLSTTLSNQSLFGFGNNASMSHQANNNHQTRSTTILNHDSQLIENPLHTPIFRHIPVYGDNILRPSTINLAPRPSSFYSSRRSTSNASIDQHHPIRHVGSSSSSAASLAAAAALAITNLVSNHDDNYINNTDDHHTNGADVNGGRVDREPSALHSILFPSHDSFQSDDGIASNHYYPTNSSNSLHQMNIGRNDAMESISGR